MEHPLLQKVRGLLRHLEAIKVLSIISYMKNCVTAIAMFIFVILMFIPFCVIAIPVVIGLSSYRALDEAVGIPELLDGKPLGIIDENLNKKQDNDK